MVDGCMDGWVGGWMGGWMDGWMDGWIDGWLGDWVGGRMDLLNATGLTPGGSSSIHIYTQTISPNWEECGPCPVFARYTLAFALQLKKKHGKP